MSAIENLFLTLIKSPEIYNKHTFLQTSKEIQRCVFYNNHKNYRKFINNFFENQYEEDSGLYVLLKHLVKMYESSKKSLEMHFKLGFHAFSVAYENDLPLIHKFFIILLHLIGFNYKDVLPLTSSFVSNKNITDKSKQILLELLDVLEETKFDLRSTVNEVTITNILKTILTNTIITDKPSGLNYQVIKKFAELDPTITQTSTAEILSYALLADNINQFEEYEQLLLVVIDTFSKLQRVENLIFNVVSVVKGDFYWNEEMANIKINNVLTKKVLESFSKNIQNLASWQIINVFKTLLFFLKEVVEHKDGLKSDGLKSCFRLEFLSELIGTFLSSIRVAEHTVAANVVEKTKKCLSELENVLKSFGSSLLNKKHNCSLMRSFLNIAYHWAELNIVIKYYSPSQEDQGRATSDYNFAACNITYVHPYLTVEEWCLISERITNFGELSCKHLLYKLFIQKVRTLYIFEKKVSDEILQDLSRYLIRDLEDVWSYIVQNKFLTNNLLSLMDPSSINLIADKLVTNILEFGNFQQNQHILNNAILLNAIVYTVITKCNKIISKRKRKFDEDSVGSTKISTKICNAMQLELLYSEKVDNTCIDKMKKIYESSNNMEIDAEVKFNESKVLEVLEVLRKFPVIFCRDNVQKFFILYMFSLHRDLNYEFSRGNFTSLQTNIENLILGTLQQYKYKLEETFNVGKACQDVLTHFKEWKDIFVLFVHNMFNNKYGIGNYEFLVSNIADKLNAPTYMHCGIIIINTINKLKKAKMPKEVKIVAENYRSIICNKMYELIVKHEPQDYLLPGYAYTLKTFLALDEEERVSKLLTKLDSYVDFALGKSEEFDEVGYLQLFNTILQNKSKIKSVEEDFPLRIWNVFKTNLKVYSRFDEYSQLILLIVGYVSNDDYRFITRDLSVISEQLINQNKYEQFGNTLKTWQSILMSNINPIKTKHLQEALEIFLSQIVRHLEDSPYDKELTESVFNFLITVVQTSHFHLTPAIVDVLILSITVLLEKGQLDFQHSFSLAVSLLSNLLKYRKTLIMDRLPPYLQQYRALLKGVCVKSNSDVLKDEEEARQLADCAFQLEKLSKSLVAHQKDMSRIAMYLIADILEQYEKVTIYPNVKMHLNNCIYSLITICDQHAVSYLMRVLSSASTEIFKLMYDHYKKYYRFTGKA